MYLLKRHQVHLFHRDSLVLLFDLEFLVCQVDHLCLQGLGWTFPFHLSILEDQLDQVGRDHHVTQDFQGIQVTQQCLLYLFHLEGLQDQANLEYQDHQLVQEILFLLDVHRSHRGQEIQVDQGNLLGLQVQEDQGFLDLPTKL